MGQSISGCYLPSRCYLLGLGGDVAAGRAHEAALLASAEGRERVRRAIESQQDHFDMFGLQLGFAYDAGAIVPDGTPGGPPHGVREFILTGRPGARVPHAWVDQHIAWRSPSGAASARDALAVVLARASG